MRRRLCITVLLAIVLGLATAGSASAHAILQDTSPPRGADLKSQPDAVVFRFNETVEGTFGAVRVYNAKGDRVDKGDAFHPGGSGPRIGVHLKPSLPQGTYTATYRVISADGHPVASGFVFSIGKPGAAGAPVDKLLGGSKVGPVTEVVFGVAKGLEYVALAAALGGLVFLLFVWPGALRDASGGEEEWRAASEAFVQRLRRLLLLASLIGALAAALAVVMQGAVAAGISGFSALDPTIVREVLGTRFGTIWGLAVPAWILTGGLSALLLRTRARSAAPALKPAEVGATGLALPGGKSAAGLIALPLLFLLLVPSLSGHATTQSPIGVMFPSNLLHVLAVSLWFGGLVVLLVGLPAATRQLERNDRTRLLAGALARFSPLALAAVIVIFTTGLIQAYVEVRSLDNLFTTQFGIAVFIKFCLLLVLIGIGAYHRRVSIPTLKRLARDGAPPGQGGVLLRRALRVEVAVIVVVLGVAAALSSYAPSIALQTGPYATTRNLGPLQLQATVDPARVGPNQVHLYFFNRRDGSQFTGAKEITVTAFQPTKKIGPLPEQVNLSGPGHYTVSGVILSAPGTWVFDVIVRVSKFDQYETKLKVPLR